MVDQSGSQAKIIIFKNYLRSQTVLIQIRFLHFVWSDPCPNCLQRLSAEDTSNEKGKVFVVFHTG